MAKKNQMIGIVPLGVNAKQRVEINPRLGFIAFLYFVVCPQLAWYFSKISRVG